MTLLALLLAGLAGGAPVDAQPAPTFPAAVESVYVDAFVLRDGQPVSGLAAADFEIVDQGILRRPELVRAPDGAGMPLVAVLAFDVSASVSGTKLRALQVAGAAFLSNLADADEASLLTFNEEVAWVVPPTTDKARVARALATLEPRGGTAVYDALYAAARAPVSPARTLVVVFSDGEDNASWLQEDEVKATLARSNALVHVVGLVPPKGQTTTLSQESAWRVQMAESRHVRLLRQLAESTGGAFWPADSAERLRAVFAEIAAAMRHRYVLRFEPSDADRPGWHPLEIRLKGRAGELRARRGYWTRAR
jgi:Ca-activated chloride channel homolog